MKKSLIYSLAAAALVASTTFTAVVSAKNSAPASEPVALSETSPLEVSNIVSTSSDETVYIITDNTGAMTKSFIGSTLNTSSTPMPLELNISCELDGRSISPTDLADKSGRVKITYDFTSVAKSPNGTLVPFLTVSGLSLDPQNFSNIELDNAKVIKESDDAIVIAGYTLPGLSQDLGVDFLPSSFSVSADVTDFSLESTYTVATNELFAEIDTSKLNSLDDLIDSLNELSSALDQIISGASSLSSGLDSAYAGAVNLSSGAGKLSSGAKDLAAGAASVNSGAENLAAGAEKLSLGLKSVVDINNSIMTKIDSFTSAAKERIAELESIIAEISATDPELAENLTKVLTELTNYYDQALAAVKSYTGGIQTLSDGANELSSGANSLAAGTAALSSGASELSSGADQLSTGAKSLVSGLSQLSNGSHTLSSGLSTFKEQGIDKLVDFASRDLSKFLNNFRSTVSAAKSYRHYNDPTATSVKFIFKSPSLPK